MFKSVECFKRIKKFKTFNVLNLSYDLWDSKGSMGLKYLIGFKGLIVFEML